MSALNGARRLLAARLDNVGDVVLLSAALRELKAAHPGLHVTLLAAPGGAQAVPLLGDLVDELWVERAVWQDLGHKMPFDPEKEQAFIHRLTEGHYDAVIIFTSFSQTPYPLGYAAYLAGIRVRAGESAEFGGSVLSHPLGPLPLEMHQAERALEHLRAIGVPVKDSRLEIQIPEEANEAAIALLEKSGIQPDYILIHPGASAEARRYDRFPEVAAMLEEPAVVTGGPKEVDLAAEVAGDRHVSLAGKTSIPVLAALIARSRLVVTTNTGALHLAEALGKPMVITYSGTDLVTHWQPRYTPARLLYREVPCSPCYAINCPMPVKGCLMVEPEEVAQAIKEVLNEVEVAR